jgi:protein-S-isoprenylcysteine O-methyltransferase Ste14
MPWPIAVVVVSSAANGFGVLTLPVAGWLSYPLCALLGILGISVLALGIRACSLRVIFGRDRSALITAGIYSYVRHPICLSCVLMGFSAAIGLKSIPGLAVAVVSLVVAYLRASLSEEPELERRFGSAYREYRRKVGMFIPKPPHR